MSFTDRLMLWGIVLILRRLQGGGDFVPEVEFLTQARKELE